MAQPLGLHQEMLLLTLHDQKGTPHWGTMYAYSLGGAILAELALQDRIVLKEVKKKKMVHAKPGPVNDEVLDHCLRELVKSKPRSLEEWIGRLAYMDLKKSIAERLCTLGILEKERAKVFFFFERTVYPELNPKPEQLLMERLRRAIFSDDADLPPRDVIITALAKGSGLLERVFDKKELAGRKARIDQMIELQPVASSAREAIAAAETTALMVAVIIPSMMTTTIINTT